MIFQRWGGDALTYQELRPNSTQLNLLYLNGPVQLSTTWVLLKIKIYHSFSKWPTSCQLSSGELIHTATTGRSREHTSQTCRSHGCTLAPSKLIECATWLHVIFQVAAPHNSHIYSSQPWQPWLPWLLDYHHHHNITTKHIQRVSMKEEHICDSPMKHRELNATYKKTSYITEQLYRVV